MRMKKRITALALAALMVMSSVAVAAGTEKAITVTPMTLTINGQTVTPTKSNGAPAEVFAYEGATYVPLRYLSELLGVQVDWDKSDPGTAKLTKEGLTIPAAPAAGPKDGVYTGTGAGFGGTITATVTLSGGKVTACTLAGDKETPAIGGAALPELEKQVVAAGSNHIDGVTGATMTSGGVKAAVADALKTAQGGAAPTTMKAGTYTATAKGRKEMKVEVTVDATSIKDIKVVEHKETYGVGWGQKTTPIESIPAAIVKSQSLAVDSVASATVTSGAIKAAVADCITQAGGDPSQFQTPVAKDTSDESYDVDVLVVGAGIAGLSTALAAQEAGLNVLVLEKTGVTGGAAARSGGKLLAADTKWQKEQGFTDSADMMYDYLMSFDRDGLMNGPLVKQFCDNSLETLMWLVDRGVDVQDVEPIHSSLTPWRVHNTRGGGGMTDGIGGQITVPITNTYENNGGKILYNCAATELLTNAKGAVTGAVGEKTGGGKVTVKAKAVVLCSGGFAKNPEMLAAYSSFLPANQSGAPDSTTGDGITMAQAVGAKNFVNPGMQIVYVNYDCYIGINEESGLIVDVKGNRLVNEWTYQSHVGSALARANSPAGYYISATKDGVCAEPYPTVQRGVTMEQVPHAASLEELAKQIGMDPAVLKATVERYNKLCAKGKDDDFGKPKEYMIPVEGDTYYAFKMNPGTSVTFGGLEIDSDSHVLTDKDKPISGLYAAGGVAFTGLFSDEYPCCGMAISSAVYFGRNAVDSILANK